ncbi:MAG: mannan-binding lectin, partial [Deltaproteobacteria bacterium]
EGKHEALVKALEMRLRAQTDAADRARTLRAEAAVLDASLERPADALRRSEPIVQPAVQTPATNTLQAMCMIEAGPLWSNSLAMQACPGLCARAGAQRFTGVWRTTQAGVMSVCECEFPAGWRCP